MTVIGRFAVTTKRKQPFMGKPRSKGTESLANYLTQIFGPRDGTRPVGLSLQSFVKVVTLLMFFR